jgi:hypothetical protein
MRCVDGGCVSCTDRIRNAEETDVDCGGGLCPACPDLDMCVVDSDCAGMRCEFGTFTSCTDGVRNGDETDVDCGGSLCPQCADRRMCGLGSDCASGRCVDFVCISCMDGIRNADETDVDCGGTICATRCAPMRMCTSSTDCASMICSMGRCNAPGCGDGLQNGAETDLDCGGGSCLGCAVGQTCVVGRDCATGVCTGGTCQAPSCTDGVTNGGETDVDCGGATTCPRCADFRACMSATDCTTMACTMGRCGTTGCVPFPGMSTDSFGYFGCTIPMTPATLPCADISTTGTVVTLFDDDMIRVPIGFSFDFYGTPTSMISIQSNGALTIEDDFIDYFNECGPPFFGPTQIIGPFWDDLNPGAGGSGIRYQTLGTAGSRQFVVRWNVAHYASTGDPLDVTVVLHEGSSDIQVCYRDVLFGDANDRGASATTGIVDGAGGRQLTYSCDMATLTDGLLLEIRHP